MSFVVAVTVVGCQSTKEIKCEFQQKLADYSGKGLSGLLSCQNPLAVSKDIYDLMSTKSKCVVPQGVGAVICESAVKSAVDSLIAKGIPTEWQCSGGVAKEKVHAFIKSQCGKLPFSL